MIHWNNLSFEEKIYEWRSIREALAKLTIADQLQVVSQYFENIPLGPRVVDFYDPSTWPTPWEIFQNSLYCINTTSILIFYSLTIANKDINIELIVGDDGEERCLYPVVDGKYLLNYYLGEVVEVDDIDGFKIFDRYTKENLKKYN